MLLGARFEGIILKSGPLRMRFQHSVADIIKFWLFYSVTAHEYSIVLNLFLLANSYEPLAVSVSVLNHVICKNWGNFQRKVGHKFM